jgi:hypothetical protein
MRHIRLSDADSRRGNGTWSTNDLPLGGRFHSVRRPRRVVGTKVTAGGPIAGLPALTAGRALAYGRCSSEIGSVPWAEYGDVEEMYVR